MMDTGAAAASLRAQSQTTPNLNLPTNRRFTTNIDATEPYDSQTGLTVSALATLRRTKRSPAPKQYSNNYL